MTSVNLDTVLATIMAYLNDNKSYPLLLRVDDSNGRRLTDEQIQELKGFKEKLGCSMTIGDEYIHVMKNGVTMHPYRTIIKTI